MFVGKTQSDVEPVVNCFLPDNRRRGNAAERYCLVYFFTVGPGRLVVSVLAIGPKVRGFKLGRGQWIFNGDKNQ
jgi:hypothetical protein